MEEMNQQHKHSWSYFDQIVAPVLVVARSGKLLFANREACRQWEAAVPGIPAANLLPAPLRRTFQDSFTQFCAGGQPDQLPLGRRLFHFRTETGAADSPIIITVSGAERTEISPPPAQTDTKTDQVYVREQLVVLVLDNHGRIAHINQPGAHRLGYTPAELIGKDWFTTCIPPELEAQIRVVFNETLAGNDKYLGYYVNEVVTASGERVMLAWHNTIIDRSRRGEVNAVYSVGSDITQWREMMSVITEKENRYRQMFEKNQAIKLVIDPQDGRIIEPNQAAVDFYGYDHATFTQMRIHDINLAPPEIIQQEMQNLFAERKSVFNFKHRLANEDVRDVLVYANLLELDGRTRIYAIIMDITAQREAEAARQLSEARYRDLFEQMPVGLYQITPVGDILRANPAIISMLGYPDEETLKGSPVIDMFADPQEWVYRRDQLIALGAESTVEFRLRRFDGRIIWTRTHARPIFDAADNLIYFQGYLEDITAEKELAAQLRQSEAHLHAVFEASHITFTLIDTDYRILWISEKAQQRSRRPDGTLPRPGMDIRPFMPPAHRPPFARYVRQALQQEPAETIIELPGSRGGPRWFELRFLPVTADDDVVIGVCLTTEDITRRKQAEDELRKNEARFLQLADNIDQIFSLINLRPRNLIYASPALETIFQQPQDLLVQDTKRLLAAIHPDDRHAVLANVNNIFSESNAEEAGLEMRIVRPSGEVRWLRTRFFPVRNAAGKVFRLAGITRDFTSERQAESRALALALEKERVKLLADFVRNASHEFRTPLTVIEMALFMLENQHDAQTREEKIRTIRQQTARMADLVEGLLLMVHLDAQESISLLKTSLNEIVREAAQPFRKQLDDQGQTLVLRLSPEEPQVAANRSILLSALHALLHNALRYSEGTEEIVVETAVHPRELRITIHDHGIGIPQDKLEIIFERFYRADEAHTTAGFGLGLPVAQRAIALHQGDITVSSTPGQGSIFTIHLPRTDARESVEPQS